MGSGTMAGGFDGWYGASLGGGAGSGSAFGPISSNDKSISVTNPGGPAVDVGVNTGLAAVDLTAMPAGGGLAWLYAPGKLLPCNNQDPRACNAVCAVTSTGLIRTEGPVDLPFSASGGKPLVGAPCYVSYGPDLGKCTATKPGVGIQPFSVPALYPQNSGIVGTVLSNANYDALGTCTVSLQLPVACEPHSLPPDQNWSGAKIDNLSNVNFFSFTPASGESFRLGPSGAGVVTPVPGSTAGATVIVWFSYDHINVPLTGLENILSCAHADTSNGWVIRPVGGGNGQLAFITAGITLGGECDLPLKLNKGINYLAFSVRGDGTIAGTYSGANPGYGSWTSIALPDSGNIFCVGGGFAAGAQAGWAAGGVLGVALINRPWSDAEMLALNATLSTPPNADNNPFTLPPAVTLDHAKFFSWVATNWNGTSPATGVNVNIGTPFSLTRQGAPVRVAEQAKWVRSLAPYFLDSKPVLYDSRGYPRSSAGVRVAFTVAAMADVFNCIAGWSVDDWDNSDNSIWLWQVTPAGGTPIMMEVSSNDNSVNGNIHYAPIAFNGIPSLNDASSYLVELIGSDKILRNGGGTFEYGSSLVDLVVPTSAVFQTDATARRLVLVAADEMIGHDRGLLPGAPMTNSAGTLFRVDYPGKVSLCSTSDGGISAALGYGTNLSMAPFAYRVFEMSKVGGLPARLDLVFDLGFYSDYAFAGVTVAQYTARYGELLDAVRVLLPESTAGGVAHYQLWKSIQASFDAVPNGNGETLAQFDAAVDVVASTRPWVTVKNVRGPNTITFNVAGTEPLQSGGGAAGSLALKNNGKVALGY